MNLQQKEKELSLDHPTVLNHPVSKVKSLVLLTSTLWCNAIFKV